MCSVKVAVILIWLLVGACGEAAHGDGGILRLSRSDANYRISVFTTPTPFRVGPVDISVLVQDAITGEDIPKTSVTVSLVLRDQPGEPMCYTATDEAATNKLFKAAVFDLPQPGRWLVQVTIKGEQGSAQVAFELEAAQSVRGLPPMWPWFSWPVPVILLFLAHQMLVWRRHRQPECTDHNCLECAATDIDFQSCQ
jgi:hypothetical protein